MQVHQHRPCLPVILLTGQQDPQLVEQAFATGAWDFLRKPISVETLTWSVKRAVQAHRMQRRLEERGRSLQQLRETFTRRWMDRSCADVESSIRESRSLMDRSLTHMESAVTRMEAMIQRTERMLSRMDARIRAMAQQRLRSWPWQRRRTIIVPGGVD